MISIWTKKWRAETQQPDWEFDNLEPQIESGILNYIAWLKDSFSGGGNHDFLEEGVMA